MYISYEEVNGWPPEYRDLFMGFNEASRGMWQQNMPQEWMDYVDDFKMGIANRIREKIAS